MAGRRKSDQSKTARVRGGASPTNVARAQGKVRHPPAHSFQKALKAIIRLISALDHPAAVIGGIAVLAHGFARTTGDIDLAVGAGPEQVGELLRTAAAAGFPARIDDAESFAKQNFVLLLEHAETGIPVDLSLASQQFERVALDQPDFRSVGNVTVPVAPLTALLIYKMVASRPKDVDDIRALLATQAPFDRQAVNDALAEIDALLETNRQAEFMALVRWSHDAR